MNLNYEVMLKGNPVKTENYIAIMRKDYEKRPEGSIFEAQEGKIRFTFISEGVIIINPQEGSANLTLQPRNKNWRLDLESIAKLNKFELKRK